MKTLLIWSSISDDEYPRIVNRYTIFGRNSVIQKKLVNQRIKESSKHVTAMIGDGVNDVMALKEADCSISVAQGSEAAKNIANLVLLVKYARQELLMKEDVLSITF